MKSSKPFQCTRCQKYFKTLKGLNVHITASHNLTPDLLAHSPAPFPSQSSSTHTRQQKSKPTPTPNRICKYCNQVFLDARGLSVHLTKDQSCNDKATNMDFQASEYTNIQNHLDDQFENAISTKDQGWGHGIPANELGNDDKHSEWGDMELNNGSEGENNRMARDIQYAQHVETMEDDNIGLDQNGEGDDNCEVQDDPYMVIFNHVLNEVATSPRENAHFNNHHTPNHPNACDHPELYPTSEEGEFIKPYPDPGAGAPIRAATEAEKRGTEPGDIGALRDPDDFELANFLFTSGLSAGDCNRFLKLKKFQGLLPWRSNYMLMKDIDKLPHGPEWIPCEKTISGNKGEQVLEWHKWNTLEVAKMLLAKKQFMHDMHWAPVRHYTSRKKKKRQYGDMRKSKWWWDLQGKIQLKDKNGTIVPVIFTSDETPLLMFGDKKAYPVNMLIGNIPKHLRRKISSGATVPVAYLPAKKIICKTNPEKQCALKWKLFHECMQELIKPLAKAEITGVEVVCSNGQVRRIYPFVASHIADFPEQCKIANIKNTFCPVCTVDWDKKGDLGPNVPLRKHQETVAAIEEHKDCGSAKFELLGLHSTEPFWATLPYIDIATLHTPDLLHQLHRGVFKDHLVKWVSQLKTPHVVDERYMAMP